MVISYIGCCNGMHRDRGRGTWRFIFVAARYGTLVILNCPYGGAAAHDLTNKRCRLRLTHLGPFVPSGKTRGTRRSRPVTLTRQSRRTQSESSYMCILQQYIQQCQLIVKVAGWKTKQVFEAIQPFRLPLHTPVPSILATTLWARDRKLRLYSNTLNM